MRTRTTAIFAAVTVLGTAVSAPHTTPVATVRHAGRWWFTTSRRAAKVAMLRRDPTASLTLPARTGLGVDVTGRCTLIDPTDPASLVRSPTATTAALPAVVRLLAGHATDVVGYLADARDLPFDWSPIGRLLVAVEEGAVELHPAPAPTDDGADVVRDREIACVVGVRTGGFPCGVAGTFDGHRVRIGPLARPIDTEAGIAVMIDGAMSDGPDEAVRPSDRRGILVRGRIDDRHLVDDGSGDHSIGLTARSITRWSGFESTTRRFDPAA